MSDIISVPEIEISTDAIDDENGRPSFFPIIRAFSNGFSLGMIALTSYNDLFLLREAVNRYIATNNVPDNMQVNKANEASTPPQYAQVIDAYLLAQGYTPIARGNINLRKSIVKTSQEIILDLADLVDITINDVADAMLYLGFCPAILDGKVGWLMRKAQASE